MERGLEQLSLACAKMATGTINVPMTLPDLVVGSSLPHSPVDIPNTFVVIVSETCEHANVRTCFLFTDTRLYIYTNAQNQRLSSYLAECNKD